MTLARVRQLFALACSTTSEDEARTAALAGVRLMKKLGLEPAEKPRVAAYGRMSDDAWRDFFRPPVRPPASPPSRPRREPHGAPNGGRWCVAASEGRCDECGGRIHKGAKHYVVAARDDVQHWCGRH